MGRFWQVMLLASVAFPYATGCAGLNEARHTTMQSLGIESPAPAARMGIIWQTQLSELPDPTKNGQTVSGLPGQMFLMTADFKHAVPNGDLTITVIDETPRPAGVKPKDPQTWHFGKDKLEKMVSIDDRWNRNIVLFIPFLNEPGADWRDVSRVRLKARYDQMVDGKQDTLYAQETQVTIDFVRQPDMGVWKQRPATGSTQGSMVGVPDPNQVLNQMRSQEQQRLGVQNTQQNVIPAGGFAPANAPQGQWQMQGQGSMQVQGPMQGQPVQMQQGQTYQTQQGQPYQGQPYQGQASMQPQWTVQTSKQPMPNQPGSGSQAPVQWPTQSTQAIPQGLQVTPLQMQQPYQQQTPPAVTGNGFVVPNLPPAN
ncbi:MAG: hypothetical protein U0798_19535 [Gemmataceae bacterium]